MLTEIGVTGVGGVELAAVIRQLREELNEALGDAEGQRLRFELGPVELSLTVTVGREATPGAKVRFWVVEAGVDTTVSRETPRDTAVPPGPDGKAASPLVRGESVREED